ncbi:hypothetical protein BWK49_12765 [Mycobacterium intracellulare subsp. chimaera]|nr:hypothetical protein BWK49_12765 [Mycobacterium intracellulare subsp. chimaera]
MTGQPREPRRGRRGLAKLRAEQTACIRGHQFDVVNTRWQVDAAGYMHRQCRRCVREYSAGRRPVRRNRRGEL